DGMTTHRRLQDSWNLLAACGVWLMSVIGGFVFPPPVGPEGGVNTWRLAQFIATAVVGLMLLPMNRWRGSKYAWYWWLAATIALAASVTSVFLYHHWVSRWTAPYSDSVKVIGGTLCSAASQIFHEEYADRN